MRSSTVCRTTTNSAAAMPTRASAAITRMRAETDIRLIRVDNMPIPLGCGPAYGSIPGTGVTARLQAARGAELRADAPPGRPVFDDLTLLDETLEVGADVSRGGTV